jgi:anaerobic magnesium-protoporphyrin IX monomethyl ester cyclase
MNVLLTHAYFLEEDPREQAIMKPYPPLGLLYIAAYLDKHGVANEVFDTTFASFSQLKEKLITDKPPVVGVYVNLMTKLNVLKLIHFIKDRALPTRVVLGGPEVRSSAENFLREGADVIVIGEGEETMLQVTQAILQGRNVDSIDGVAFLNDGNFVQTHEREKLRSLDDLPPPARHKINLKNYLNAWTVRHGSNTISISTMRGCPYTCKWCSRGVYGLSYRRRSARNVVKELKTIISEYQPDSFWFVDDVFTISHKWLEAFRDEIQNAGLRIRYECITRADRMSEEVIQMLRETGCFRIWIGAESGSQKVIDLMDRRVQVGQVRDMIRMSRRYGIEAGTFIMLGYPGETQEDIEETIAHLKDSNPDHFTITVAYPIRGTELFEEVQITEAPEWSLGSDREIEFQRTYPRRYYDFAVRRVVNEVHYFKNANKRNINAAAFKFKSLIAKLGMMYYSRRPTARQQ